MYEYFIGYITAVHSSYVVLEINGIGYLIYVSDPYQYKVSKTDSVKIYIHQVITDSSQILYGFFDENQKNIFEKLIQVSGIGPKNALGILSGKDTQSLLNAINEENVTFLTKFPGIGKKTAKQIILDLKGKLDAYVQTSSNIGLNSSNKDNNEVNKELSDALDALVALGYSNNDVKKLKDSLAKENGLTTNEYLSKGLKLLN